MAGSAASLTAGAFNLDRLKHTFERVRTGVGLALGKRTVENYLKDKVKARFEPRGSNPYAQRDPQGRFWKFLAQSTVERKRRAGYQGDRSHALYQSGELQRSIQVLKKLPGMLMIQRGGNHYFELGVRRYSRAAKYANFQNRGGITPRGGVVPAREFMGVSNRDAEEIGFSMKKVILETIQ